MALDNEDRAFLEKTIDSAIGQVPDLMRFVREEVYQKLLQYKDGGDVVLGFAIGMIFGGFIQYSITRQQRQPNPDEISEANEVIFRRTREIKEAIFKCG